MMGDHRIRHCAECQLNVFNFSALSEAEIEDLLQNSEGRICARFYQRADGTMLTRNCPIGLSRAFRNASRLAASFLSAVFALGPAIAAAVPQLKQNAPLTQIKPMPQPMILLVLDASGAVVPNAKVSLTNESSGVETCGNTNDAGELRLAGLVHGKYKVVITSLGFRTYTAEGISLPAKTPPQYTLEIGAFMGEVVVVDHSNPVQKFFSHLRRFL
jgi:hypothetical protein